MYHYLNSKKLYCFAKPLELAELNTAERVAKIWNTKPIFVSEIKTDKFVKKIITKLTSKGLFLDIKR